MMPNAIIIMPSSVPASVMEKSVSIVINRPMMQSAEDITI